MLKGGAYGAKGGSVAYNEWWGTPVGFIEYIRYLCLGPPEWVIVGVAGAQPDIFG